MLTNHCQIGRLISGGEGRRLGGDFAFVLAGALQDEVLQFYPSLFSVRSCLRTERIWQGICFANGGFLYRDVMLSCNDGSRPHSKLGLTYAIVYVHMYLVGTRCHTRDNQRLIVLSGGNGISEDNAEFNFSSGEWLQ